MIEHLQNKDKPGIRAIFVKSKDDDLLKKIEKHSAIVTFVSFISGVLGKAAGLQTLKLQ